MSARLLDCSLDDYFRDPCEVPSLSASTAIELIHRSPLHAWTIHPRLGGKSREATAATNDGTLIHALLLGKGEEKLAIIDVDSFRTNAAKAARDAALAEGKTVVKAADFEAAKAVAHILRERIADLGIELKGTSEEKLEWIEQTEQDGEVLCRGMIDHWYPSPAADSATIIDLKTIRSADLKTIQRHVLDYGYDIAERAYTSAIGKLMPEALGRIDFIFLFVELDPPFAVTPVRLNGQFREIGAMKWDRACTSWARCLKAGTEAKHWPAYVNEITTVHAPEWALQDAVFNSGGMQ